MEPPSRNGQASPSPQALPAGCCSVSWPDSVISLTGLLGAGERSACWAEEQARGGEVAWTAQPSRRPRVAPSGGWVWHFCPLLGTGERAVGPWRTQELGEPFLLVS